MSIENVDPTMTKHQKRLSKAETDDFRSNDREKTNGLLRLLSPKEIAVLENELSAKNSSMNQQNQTKRKNDNQHNENVGPMMIKHPKKLSKAETVIFRSNDREKTNGLQRLLSPKEIAVLEYELSAKNSSMNQQNQTKCKNNNQQNENVGPMMTKHQKKLSKAETDAFRSNDREKTYGLQRLLLLKEVAVKEYQLSAKNSSMNQLILPKFNNQQLMVQAKMIGLLNECVPKSLEGADSVAKTEPSPIPRRDSNENQSENQGEVERSLESKPVIAARRDLFVSDKDDSSAPSQTPGDDNFTVKRTVKKFEKRPITLEGFKRALTQGKTCEEVIDEKATVVANECAQQIQSSDEDEMKIIIFFEQRYKRKNKKTRNRMRRVHDARVKKLNDRLKQANQWCCVCKRTANLYCCRTIYYCSLSCQENNWPTHKDDCEQQVLASSNPCLTLHWISNEEDIDEDKKVVMENMSSLSGTSESTVTPVNVENNLIIPNVVPVLPNQPVTKSPLPKQI